MTMKTIRKYPFGQSSTVFAPIGKVLLADYQDNGSDLPTLWIEHDADAERVEYVIMATGAEWNESESEHVGSAICGRYVWHVYRLT